MRSTLRKQRLKMLSKRLLCCSEMVQGSVACDIGTDHAWLPIYLVQSGKCERAYACDIAEGPLSFARKNLSLIHI